VTGSDAQEHRLDRWSSAFIAVMSVLCCVLVCVMIWAVIRLVLFYT
jgi:hypothetical protein